MDHTPIVQIKPRKNGHINGRCFGVCHWHVTPIVIDIVADKRGKVSLHTLVHEFLHACGYSHKWELNGWANFGFGKGLDRDRFTTLVVKDLTGKKEIIL